MIFSMSRNKKEVTTMKKNRPVEVEIKEIDGKHQLTIGKKIIGEVLVASDNKYQAVLDNDILGVYKSLDDAFEEVLRNWNLHN